MFTLIPNNVLTLSSLRIHIRVYIQPPSVFTEQSTKMFIRGRPITMYIPSNIQNYEDLKMELPSAKLELDWVYPDRLLAHV